MSRAANRAGAPRRMVAGRRLLSAVVLVLVGLGIPGGAASHDGRVGVFVEPDQVSPGGAIAVHGDNVSTDDPVEVDLIAGEARIQLATAVTDGQGSFTVGAILPTDLLAGTYAIEVNGVSGVHMTAFVQVAGAPIFDGQGAPPGQDEGLPALPPAQNGSVRGSVGAAVPPAGPTSDVDLVPLAALIAAVGGFALFLRWTRRPTAARAESADLT